MIYTVRGKQVMLDSDLAELYGYEVKRMRAFREMRHFISNNAIMFESLSWFIVSARDYKRDYDWIWDKLHHCCYGMPKDMRTDNVATDLWEYYANRDKSSEYFAECILMPELHMYSFDEAKTHIVSWCDKNEIYYIDDTDKYKQIEADYWGYDD